MQSNDVWGLARHVTAPVSNVGELWLLGEHRLYCGTALEDSAYAALMNNERAAMVFTDPPYNVPIAGHASGLGAVRHQDFVMASGEMNEAEFTGFPDRCREWASRVGADENRSGVDERARVPMR